MTTFHPTFRAIGAAVLALGLVTACGGGGGGEAAKKPPANPIATGQVPSYYPSAYSQIVDAAKKEGQHAHHLPECGSVLWRL